jgi:hypothetical protein
MDMTMVYVPSYDYTRTRALLPVGKSFTLPYGDYAKVTAVQVKPTNCESNRLTIAYVTTRRRDAHKDIYICGTDGKIHRYRGKVPQTKHVKIPQLAKLLGLDRSWDIALRRVA